MKTLLTTLLLAILLAPASTVQAQLSKAGTTAAEFLRIPVGARSSAMSAFTSTVNDASAMVLNPAGLADLNSKEVMFEFTDWFLDMNHSYFGAAIPTKNNGAVGIHVLAFNAGEFQETTAEAQGLTGRTFGAYSLTFGLSYAQYLFDQFSVGGTAKLVREQISNSTASAVAFDVGTMYDTPFYGVRLGVSVTNVGSKMQMTGNDLIIRSDPDPASDGNYEPDALLATVGYDLPLMLRVGLAWEAINNEQLRATIAVDGNNPSNNNQSVSIGTELAMLNDMVFIRGGVPYIGQVDVNERFNAGLGVRYKVNNGLTLAFNYTYHGYRFIGDVSKMNVQIFF